METWQIVSVGVLMVVSGFFFGIAFATKSLGKIKEENERLNRELHKLTDRDERGRFKGGK